AMRRCLRHLVVSNCRASSRLGVVPLWVCGSVLIVIAIAPAAPAQQHERDLVARLREEIPDKWNEIVLPNVQTLHSTYTLTETNPLKNGEVSRKARGEYKSSGLCFLYRIDHEIPPRDQPESWFLFPRNESFVVGRNSRYQFHFTSPPGPPVWENKGFKQIAAISPEWMPGPGVSERTFLPQLSEAMEHFSLLPRLFDGWADPGVV